MQKWMPVGFMFAGMLVLACIACHKVWGVGPDPLVDEIRLTDERIADSKRSIAALQKELVASRWKLDTFRGVGQQPDWSVMLKLVTEALGKEVVLRSCELNEIGVPVGPAPSVGRAGVNIPVSDVADSKEKIAFVLTINGFGRSQTAVSQFVLRMERAGMFDSVRLVSTIREPFLNAKAIAFRLKCRLDGAPAE